MNVDADNSPQSVSKVAESLSFHYFSRSISFWHGGTLHNDLFYLTVSQLWSPRSWVYGAAWWECCSYTGALSPIPGISANYTIILLDFCTCFSAANTLHFTREHVTEECLEKQMVCVCSFHHCWGSFIIFINIYIWNIELQNILGLSWSGVSPRTAYALKCFILHILKTSQFINKYHDTFSWTL